VETAAGPTGTVASSIWSVLSLVRTPTPRQRISHKAYRDFLGQRHTTPISFNILPFEYLCLSLSTPLTLASSLGSIRVIVVQPTAPSTCQIQRKKEALTISFLSPYYLVLLHHYHVASSSYLHAICLFFAANCRGWLIYVQKNCERGKALWLAVSGMRVSLPQD
jgi:hypothetical protein